MLEQVGIRFVAQFVSKYSLINLQFIICQHLAFSDKAEASTRVNLFHVLFVFLFQHVPGRARYES